MLSPDTFYDLASGRKRGVRASAARSLLRAFEFPYTWAVELRNRRFDSSHSTIHRAEVPVVSVGNLTLGGTGKTPFVAWLARWFQAQNIRVAIVSRGYGATENGQNDEARELASALPGVPHVQNPDRVAAAREAIDRYGAELVLLDDGFQHRRLARDLDIVLLDACSPFGYGHVFPRGTLREPAANLRRASVVCLMRADAVGLEERERIRREAARLAPDAAWCTASHAPRRLVSAAGDSQPCTSLASERIAVFCGIGNPAGFRHTLESLGAEIVSWHVLPDHFAYEPKQVAELDRRLAAVAADRLVCTRKDLVKLGGQTLGGRPLWSLEVELALLEGMDGFAHRLAEVTQLCATTKQTS